MNNALVLGRLILTTTRQGLGAPIVDLCGGRILDGQSWHGHAIHLTPWRFNCYGDRLEGKAFCIGLLRSKTH